MVFKVRTERTQKVALGEAEWGNGKSQKGEKWRITDRFTRGLYSTFCDFAALDFLEQRLIGDPGITLRHMA